MPTEELQPAGPAPAAPPPRRRLLHTVGIGLGAGLLNGLIGLGGGILIVPGLVFLRKISPKAAVSTSLATVLVMSLCALAVHVAIAGYRLSAWGLVVLIVCGGLGSQGGAWLLNRVSTRTVLVLFGTFTLVSATHLIAIGLDLLPALVRGVTEPPLWSYAAMGVVGGFFSGMLGLGGGGLVVLGFSVIFHTSVVSGLPIALSVNAVNAGSAVLVQWRSGQVLWAEVRALVPSGLVGILLGTGVALVLPENALRIVFAAFFLYVSYRLYRRAWRG